MQESKKKSLFIITGASRGFGRCLATALPGTLGLLQDELEFLLLASNEESLIQTKDLVEKAREKVVENKASVTVSYAVADLSNIDKLQESIPNIFQKYDETKYARVILVHNAATTDFSTIKDLANNFASVRKEIDINLTSCILITSLFLKHFSKPELVIVNVSSGVVNNPIPENSIYNAGKSAREHFFRTLAVEATEDSSLNISVINYDPGPMYTDIAKEGFAKCKSKIIATLVATFPILPPEIAAKHLSAILGSQIALADDGKTLNDTFSSSSSSSSPREYRVVFQNNMKGALFCVGNPLLDISCNVDGSVLTKYDLKPSNAILADPSGKHLPLYDELCAKSDVEYIPGGAGQNSLRAAQWMIQIRGATRYFGAVGKDNYADILKKEATKDGLETFYYEAFTLNDKNEKVYTPTGVCAVCIVDKDRSLVANLSAANGYKKSHLDENFWVVENAKVVYITGFFLTVSVDSMVAIGEHCAKQNKPFLLNISAPFVVEFFYDSFVKVFNFVDVLFGNEHEALALGKKCGWVTSEEEAKAQAQAEDGQDDENDESTKLLIKIAKKVLSDLPKQNKQRERYIIFTQGHKATVVVSNDSVLKLKPEHVPKHEIVDTNGAGDCFVGGFLSQYVLGRPLSECVRAGHYCAGVCIRTSGIKFTGKPQHTTF